MAALALSAVLITALLVVALTRSGRRREPLRELASSGSPDVSASPRGGVATLPTALTLGAVLVVTLLVLALAQLDRGRELLADAGLAPPDEPYTELAFARPEGLPQAPGAGAAVPIAFRIRNQEGERRTYSWSVVEGSGGQDVVRARGSLDVGAGARVEVRTRASLACTGRRVRVAVALEDPARQIGFWVRCPPPEAAA